MEERDGHRQIETPRSGASRIDEQDAAVLRAGRLVRMPAYDDLESRGDGIKIERVNVVKDVYRCEIRLDDFGFGKIQGPRLGIHISPHGKNRGESFQRFQNFRIAHVACMNDQVRALEGAKGLRAQQSMRVRDQANRSGIQSFRHGSTILADNQFV